MRNAISILLVLLLLAACRSTPTPTPEPEPQPDPEPTAVTAVFSASTTGGVVPFSIDFDAGASTGDGLNYSWAFGAEGSASGAQVSHTFVTTGDHVVTLTVTDENGTSAETETVIRAVEHATASFKLDSRSGYVPFTVSADASLSIGDGLTYAWDFGDGAGSDGQVAAHEYTSPGEYTVTLTVTDSLGFSDEATAMVLVAPAVDPLIDFSPQLAYAGTPVQFDASSSGGEGLIYQWRFSDDNTLQTGPTVSHSFGSPGEHTVTLTISDSRGTVLSASQQVIAAQPAQADFTVSSRVATVNLLPVEFSAAPGYGFEYSWGFGDGAPASNATDPTHIFGSIGEFTTTLTVTDLLGNTDSSSVSVTVAQPIVRAAIGEWNSYLITANGELFAYGRGAYGANGDGTKETRELPVKVQFPAGTTIVQVAPGHAYAQALDSDGQVWGWGETQNGRTGTGSFSGHQLTPALVNFPFPPGQENTRITQIATGTAHSLALDEDGHVWGWGRSDEDQLTQATPSDAAAPVPIQVPSASQVVQLAAGEDHSFALTESGELWGWGSNKLSALAQPATVDHLHYPTNLGVPPTRQVAAGAGFSAVLDDNGNIWHWGRVDPAINYNSPDYSRLIDQPQQLTGLGVDFEALTAHHETYMALDSAGHAWAWGHLYGLGNDAENHALQPVQVTMPTGIYFTSLDAGYGLGIALDQYGMVWTWGYSPYGGTGDGLVSTPQRVHYPAAP